jgi:DNA-binding PadR family transcriptional regulator
MRLLTKQEEILLLAVFCIPEDAYLINIREYLIQHAGLGLAFGSIYTALNRLRKLGYVETRIGEPEAIRGGRAIKYYQLTKEGIKVLKETKKIQESFWQEFSVRLKELEQI